MQKLVKEYLNELNRRHKRRRRVEVAVVLLVVIVASSVVGILTQYGFAMTEGAKCGHEEHQHGEECYQDVLVCGQEEGAKHQHSESCYQPSRALSCGQEESEGHRHGDGCYQSETSQVCGQEEGEEHQHSDGCYQTENVLVCGQEEYEGHQHGDACFQTENVLVCGQNEEEGHSHTDACHQQQMTCEKEEHVHTDWCWIDVNADVESASMWDAQYANVTWADSWGEDLVAAAQKQLGYKESVENYWIAEDGSHKGYTRYGQFVGDVYVNWDAAFVNFCLHYAGLEESGMFMDETDTARWHERFVLEKDNGYLVAVGAYEPQAGDIVFFERQGEETAKQMGIVSSYDKERNEIKVIEGNSANEVKENEYAANDEHIFAYLKTTEMERAHKHLDDMAAENGDVPTEPGAEGGENASEPGTEDGENGTEPGSDDGENASEDGSEDGENGTESGAEDGENGTEPGEDGEEEIVELVTEVDNTTITLSGPASSFEKGKEYSIQAELIVASEKTGAQNDGDGTGDGESVSSDGAASDNAAKTDDGISTVSDGAAKADERISASDDGMTKRIGSESVASDERIEAIEEAVTKIAEEKEKEVGSYQAFDIKLMVDGEEVQPLGPVSVKFSSHEVAKAVEDEATEVNVIHVDETNGEATDMEATATEEKDVVIETEHFSVYVYVQYEVFNKSINVTIQHWGENIETLAGSAKAGAANATDGYDTAFDKSGKVKTTKEYCAAVINPATGEKCGEKKEECKKHTNKNYNCEIYSADELQIPNEYYTDIRTLSKLYKQNENKELVPENYEITKVWVLDNVTQQEMEELKGETWAEKFTTDSKRFHEYQVDTVTGSGINDVRLTKNSVIRFWYKSIEKASKKFDVTFYDYDITDGVHEYSGDKYLDGNRKGINSDSNYQKGEEKNKLYVGQRSGGNTSEGPEEKNPGVAEQMLSGAKLNGENGSSPKAEYHDLKMGTGNVIKGIVTGLDQSGNLQFNENIRVPENLFSPGIGSTEYKDYKLGFKQNGDTYTLQYVYNENGSPTTGDLTTFYHRNSWGNKYILYANEFWPLDKVPEKNNTNPKGRTDPLLGADINEYKLFYEGMYKNYEGAPKAITAPNDFPDADEKPNHNWYFGMTYKVDFTIGDYTGPMEYYFRGDDDFWLFVDGQLIVDLGGIHPASSESVDLRKAMEDKRIALKSPDNPNGNHTLKVFFMERGASGSCCYMQFTLPNSQPQPIVTPETIEHAARKEWDDNNSQFRPEEIVVQLIQKNSAGTQTTNKESIILNAENNWSHTWSGLPKYSGKDGSTYEYSYEIKEIKLPKGYTSQISEDGKTLTNKLDPIKVAVEKDWQNEGAGGASYRPDEIKVRLYANDEPYKFTYEVDEDKDGVIDKDGDGNPIYKYETYDVTLNAQNGWKAEFVGLPQYYYTKVEDSESESANGDEYIAEEVVYSVVELDSKGEPILNDGTNAFDKAQYKVTYGKKPNPEAGTGDEAGNADTPVTKNGVYKDTLVVTNTLLTDFRIVKVGSGESTEQSNPLQGAKFILTPCNQEGTPVQGTSTEVMSYTVVSNEKGLLIDETTKKELKLGEGTYLLKEIEAPIGYVLSSMEWKVTIGKDGKAAVEERDVSKNEAFRPKEPDAYDDKDGDHENVLCVYYFKNEVIYALPSTGGLGIYWYMFGGVLLMSAAAFMTYRNKRKGVLKS